MRKQLLIGAAMVTCTAVLICVGSARAEEPVAGRPFSTPNGILCDERSQISEILEGAKVDNGKGIIPVFKKWNEILDKAGEPTCMIQPIIKAVVKSVEDIGESQGFDGTKVHGWVVEISGTDGETGYLLYGEALPGTDA